MFYVIKIILILTGAIIVGNWFLEELKKGYKLNLPWYKPYLSLPGIIIICAILSPLIIKLFR